MSYQFEPYDAGDRDAVEPLPHSGLGLISCIMAGLSGFVAVLMVGAAVFVTTGAEEAGAEPPESTLILVGLALFAVIGLALVGGVLGIAGLFQRDRRSLFALLGLVFNGLILAGLIGLMVIGAAMQ